MAKNYGASDPLLVTIKAKFKPSTKGPGIDGVLMMRSRGFIWTPNDPRAAVNLDVDFTSIKSHRWSKETPNATSALLKLGTHPDPAVEGGYIFVFSSFKDRDRCRDVYGAFQAKSQAPGRPPAAGGAGAMPPPSKPAPPQASPKVPAELLDPAEMQRRQHLLQSDANLRRLHQELVLGGILKEEEFWATRKELLEGEDQRRKRQRTGLASAMLADVRPVTDGRTNTVTFSLTPEIIAQIFSEKPAVLRAFLQCVPARMSEKEFWTKYCRAEYLFSTKNTAAAAAEAADDEDLAMFVNEDGRLDKEAQQKVRGVDPTVDMAADDADDYSTAMGHGILRDGGKEGPSTDGGPSKGRRTIFRDINRHAAVVLQGRLLDADMGDARTVATALAARAQEAAQGRADEANPEADRRRTERVQQAIEIDDLQGPSKPSVVPLRIQDPRKYFDVQSAAAGEASVAGAPPPRQLSPAQAAGALQRQLAKLKGLKVQDPVMPPDTALQVLKDLTQHISTTRQLEGPAAEKTALAPLPDSTKAQLFAHAEAVRELLRHFWATYPITSQTLLDKAERHKKGIDLLYDKLERFKAAAPKDQRHLISQLLQPMFQSMDAALAHYEAEAQKRSQKAAGRPSQAAAARNGSVRQRAAS